MPEIDLGPVVGPRGPQGAEGPRGAQGVQGPAGAPAAINGYNTSTITASGNVALSQTEGNMTIRTTEALDGAVKWRSGRNLLINWYFVGGGSQQGGGQFPINQRCVSGTVETPGYFIDRWKLVSGTVQLTAAGLVLNGTMAQVLENDPGDDVVAFVLTSDGLVRAAYDKAARTFSITAAGETLLAAKLELGSQQTLAHKEGDAWVLNEIPDYATELAKCRRYYYNSLSADDAAVIPKNRWVAGNSYAWALKNYPVAMRIRPALTIGSVSFGNANPAVHGTDFESGILGDPGSGLRVEGLTAHVHHKTTLWLQSIHVDTGREKVDTLPDGVAFYYIADAEL